MIPYKAMHDMRKQRDDGTTLEAIVGRMVRIGIVMDVNNQKHIARVRFPNGGETSDWLYVLDNKPFIPDYDVPQRTEDEAGGSGDAEYESHHHELIIKQWMPKVNDVVVVLYLPVRNGDGFVLGSIHEGD